MNSKGKNHSTEQKIRVHYHYKSYKLISLDHLSLRRHIVNTNNIKHLLMNTVKKWYGLIYLNKKKSEAVQKFIELYKYMKNICDYNLKEVKSDDEWRFKIQ